MSFTSILYCCIGGIIGLESLIIYFLRKKVKQLKNNIAIEKRNAETFKTTLEKAGVNFQKILSVQEQIKKRKEIEEQQLQALNSSVGTGSSNNNGV